MCIKHIESTFKLENGSVLVNSTCQLVKLVLFWEPARGMFDLDYYSVNIAGIVTNVSNMVFEAPPMSNGDYQVLVSTVSKCQEASAAKIDVKAGKQSYILYI